jgi:hypothetical protein
LRVDGDLAESVQAVAQDSVARLHEVYRLSSAAARGGARLFIEVAETAWGSARLLNDRVVRNVDANTAAAFDAAEACARAGSLMEVAALQGNYLQLLLAATSEQTRELLDLSTRATQHVLETMQAASARMLRTDF